MFDLGEERRSIRDVVRKFVRSELMPMEQTLLRREMEGGHGASPGLLPDEMAALQEKARAIGFWGIELPQQYGGADLDPLTLAVIHEELGRTFVDFQFGGTVLPALFACSEEQKERYLLPAISGERIFSIAISEPQNGSDAKGMRTTARRDGDGWIVNGEKTWITRAHLADFLILFAKTPVDGDPDAITCFLVDREMGWTSSQIQMMGSRDKIGSISLVDVRVPGANVLGRVGKGFEHAMPFIYRNRAYVLSAKNLGAMARMIEMGIDWANQRSTFGKRLAERENIAFSLAESEIDLRTSKLLVYHAASQATEDRDYRHEACSVKAHVARASNRVADRMLQLHGAMGYAKECVIERWYRDLRVERIYDGTDEINLANVARNLLRGHVRPGDMF